MMTVKEQIELVKRIVAHEAGISVDEMCGPKRPDLTAWARQVAMWVCREIGSVTILGRKFNKIPLQLIGQEFGNRDHGTVIYAVKCVNDAMEIDPDDHTLHRLRDRIFAEIKQRSSTPDAAQGVVIAGSTLNLNKKQTTACPGLTLMSRAVRGDLQ